MKKTGTADHNGDDSTVEPNVLSCAYSMYADLQSTGFNRQDVLSLLCGLLFVAVSDDPRKPKRKKRRRPKAKGSVGEAAGSA